MAAGMIDMLLPLRSMPVPASAGLVVFGVAAVAAVAAGAARWRTGRAGAVLALVTAADLAVMAYMFAAPGSPSSWLTYLLCGWLTLEAVYAASGRLTALSGYRTARTAPVAGPAPMAGPAVDAEPTPDAGQGLAAEAAGAAGTPEPAGARSGAAAAAVVTVDTAVGTLERAAATAEPPPAVEPARPGRRHRLELALSVGVTCLVMAYMLLAMHYGSSFAGHGVGPMPGMAAAGR
jgi:hypothetical protein